MKVGFVAISVVSLSLAASAAQWVNLDADHHYSGPSLTEADLQGKVVMVDNWGVHCPPCRASLPRIQEIWNSFKSKPFVLVGSHCQGKSPEKVAELVAANKITYPMYERFGMAGAPSFNAIPFIYVVNHRGRVVYSGHSDREATEALVTAIADIGQPRSLCPTVPLVKFKMLKKSLYLGKLSKSDLKKLETAAAGKNPAQAEEAKAILSAIEESRKEVKEEIDAIKDSGDPEEAFKLVKDYVATWPKEGAEYKDLLASLQKKAAEAKAKAAAKK